MNDVVRVLKLTTLAFVIALFGILLMTGITYAEEPTLHWDSPVYAEGVTPNDGAKVYWQATSGGEIWSTLSENTPGAGSMPISELNLTPNIEYKIWLTGYQGKTESIKTSNIVKYTLAADKPDVNEKPVVIYIPYPVEKIEIEPPPGG